jgi:hypothetical protein
MAFRLSTHLDPAETQLNESRLRRLLKSYGQYPSKYRLLVWRFMLRLPGNGGAYALLAQRGTHPCFADVGERFPIRNKHLRGALTRGLSTLGHWSPVFSQVPFLPALVFPFVKLFNMDGLAATETVMTLLVNWMADWFDAYPHPPLPVLNKVERLLGIHDPELLRHLVKVGCPATSYAWPLLSTLFTETLSKGEWLKLFDHILSHPEDPDLLLAAAASWLVSQRVPLLSLNTASDIQCLVRRQFAVDANHFVKFMYHIRSKSGGVLATSAETRERRAQAAAQRGAASEGGSGGEGGGVSIVPAAAEVDVRGTARESLFPLPRGNYPAFLRYPQLIVDHAAQERERIEREEAAIVEKKAVMASLKEKSAALAEEEKLWQQQQVQMSTWEEEQSGEAAKQNARRAGEQAQLQAQVRTRRVAQVAQMEELARRGLALQRQRRQAERRKWEVEMERKAASDEEEAKAKMEEEELLNIEFDAHKRVVEAEIEAQLAAEEEAFEKEMALADEARKADSKLVDERLQTEEKERALQLQVERANLARRTKLLEARRRRREKESLLLVREIEREGQLATAERRQRLRHHEQTTTEQGKVLLESQHQKLSMLEEEEKRQERILAAEQRRWRLEQEKERFRILEREQRAQAEEVEQREQRLRELEMKQRQRSFQENVATHRVKETEEILEEEKKVQRVVLGIDQQRSADRRMELEMLLREQELQERSAFQQAARATANNVVVEERARFQQIRAELSLRAREGEEDEISRHGAIMGEVMAGRERSLQQQGARIRHAQQDKQAADMAVEEALAAEGRIGSVGGGGGRAAQGTSAHPAASAGARAVWDVVEGEGRGGGARGKGRGAAARRAGGLGGFDSEEVTDTMTSEVDVTATSTAQTSDGSDVTGTGDSIGDLSTSMGGGGVNARCVSGFV